MSDILSFLPLSLVVAFAIIAMLTEVFLSKNKEIIAYVSLVGLVISALSTVTLWKNNPNPFTKSYFDGMFVIDNFSMFFYLLFILCAAICMITSVGYLKRENIEHGEYYSLVMFALSGMMLIASGGDLLILFLGLEIMSISIYVLVGFKRREIKSNEAALKYFFLGAFSAGFILYGIALIYGSCASTNLVEIREFLANNNVAYPKLTIIGLLMLLIGVLFKVSAVPFHVWSPDVYEGAPSPVTGFMISSVKAASFAMFLKIFLVSFILVKSSWSEIITILSVVTMFAGNIFAFTQDNIKRMLAYSSISHTGYLLIGIAALTNNPDSIIANSMLYYLVAYSVANLGIFACITYLSQKGEEYLNIDDYSGLGFKYPLIGITMSIFMFSLIGVPPTGGFFAKYYLFTSAMREGMFYLVLIAILNSMMSVYYYLRVVAVMYLKDAKITLSNEQGKTSVGLVLVYTAITTLWLGIGTSTILSVIPGAHSLIEWSKASILSIL